MVSWLGCCHKNKRKQNKTEKPEIYRFGFGAELQEDTRKAAEKLLENQ